MAFSATVGAILDRRKTCTRREADSVAAGLRPGDMIHAVDRIQGLTKGARARTLAVLRVEDVGPAPPLDEAEVRLEGFAGRSVAFVEQVIRNMYKDKPLVRVLFSYVGVAAPQIVHITATPPTGLLDRTRRELAALAGRRDPSKTVRAVRAARRRDLRQLLELIEREQLLDPDEHAAACVALDKTPIELWRLPKTRRRAAAEAVDDGQRDLFS